jgi:hypothetical protein
MKRIRIVKTPILPKENKGGPIASGNMIYPVYKPNQMSEPKLEFNKHLSAVPRDESNVEVEKGEQIHIPDMGGLAALFKAGGKPHSQGGTPLNLPDDAFVYSQTAKMKIKDPEILKEFGKFGKKIGAGFLPSELAKQYDLNAMRKVLADKTSDKLQRDTAEKQIMAYNLKLAKLGLVQEAKKGFPDGIPSVALSYLAQAGVKPEQVLPLKGVQEQQEQSTGQDQDQDQEQGEMGKYGMSMAKHHYFNDGGSNIHSNTGTYMDGNYFQRGGSMSQDEYNKLVADLMYSKYQEPTPKYKHKYIPPVKEYILTPEQQKQKKAYEDQLKLKTDALNKQWGGEQTKQLAAIAKAYQADPKNLKLASALKAALDLHEQSKQQYAQNMIDPISSQALPYFTAPIKHAGQKLGDIGSGIANVAGKGVRGIENLFSAPAMDPQLAKLYEQLAKVSQTAPVAKPVSNPAVNPMLIPDPMLAAPDTTGAYADYQNYLKTQGKKAEGGPIYNGGGGVKSDDAKYTTYNDGSVLDKNRKTFVVNATVQVPKTTTKAAPVSEITTEDPDKLKGAYKAHPGELTPEGKNPSSQWTTEELKQKYKDQGIDYENMTDAEAQAALYDKADPFQKAFMWGHIGNTKKGLALGQQAKFDKYRPKDGETAEQYKTRLTNAGYTPDSLNKELEPFKHAFADGYRGLREAWLLVPPKKAAAVVDDNPVDDKGPGAVVPGDLAGTHRSAPAPWWLQDKIKTAGAATDFMRIKKYLPWGMPVTPAVGEPTFYDPTRELAANAEMANIGTQGATAFGNPQQYAATFSGIQGAAAKNAADILGKYNNMNVTQADSFNALKSDIFNKAQEANSNLAKNLYDGTTIANQQYDNSRNMARQELRQSYMDAVTNRAQTQTMNTLYPHYKVDPRTGGFLDFTKGSNIKPSSKDNESAVKAFAQVVHNNPNIYQSVLAKIYGYGDKQSSSGDAESSDANDYLKQYMAMQNRANQSRINSNTQDTQ